MIDRFQVPGEQFIRSADRTYEKDGYVAKWRGIRDAGMDGWW